MTASEAGSSGEEVTGEVMTREEEPKQADSSDPPDSDDDGIDRAGAFDVESPSRFGAPPKHSGCNSNTPGNKFRIKSNQMRNRSVSHPNLSSEAPNSGLQTAPRRRLIGFGSKLPGQQEMAALRARQAAAELLPAMLTSALFATLLLLHLGRVLACSSGTPQSLSALMPRNWDWKCVGDPIMNRRFVPLHALAVCVFCTRFVLELRSCFQFLRRSWRLRASDTAQDAAMRLGEKLEQWRSHAASVGQDSTKVLLARLAEVFIAVYTLCLFPPIEDITYAPSSEPSIVKLTPGPSRPCVDTSNQCGDWAKAGECEKNPRFMLRTCSKACGGCGATTSAPQPTVEDREPWWLGTEYFYEPWPEEAPRTVALFAGSLLLGLAALRLLAPPRAVQTILIGPAHYLLLIAQLILAVGTALCRAPAVACAIISGAANAIRCRIIMFLGGTAPAVAEEKAATRVPSPARSHSEPSPRRRLSRSSNQTPRKARLKSPPVMTEADVTDCSSSSLTADEVSKDK